MKIGELLSHPSVQLPISWTGDDFEAFVKQRLDEYLQLLDELTEPDDIAETVREARPRMKALCNKARQGIRAAFQGHPHDAYRNVVAGIKKLLDEVQAHAKHDLGSGDLKFLYRVRRQTGVALSREGLFHIPFEHRHKVHTQRYSVPGLPCLYLGGSIFTCWAEMGRPPFHELQASAFWLCEEKAVKIIDFSNRPARLRRYLIEDREVPALPAVRDLLATHLKMWPLMALCSIIVRHRDSPFKPEYIVPQIVLQWITKEQQFDGLCYFSTHVKAVTDNPLPTCNIVLPAREVQARGRCAWLQQLLKMTEPYGWEFLRAVRVGDVPENAYPDYNFEFIRGQSEPYRHTEFGIVETRLNQLALEIEARNQDGELQLGHVEP